MERTKQIAAAISAAVQLYLEAEQQIALPAPEPKAPEIPRQVFSPWVLAGRQTSMETRRLWQMRFLR